MTQAVAADLEQVRQQAQAEIDRLTAERDQLTAERTEVSGLLAKLRARGRKSITERVQAKVEERALTEVDAETQAAVRAIDDEIGAWQSKIDITLHVDQYAADCEAFGGLSKAHQARVSAALAALRKAGELAADVTPSQKALREERDRLGAERERLGGFGHVMPPLPAMPEPHRNTTDGQLSWWKAADELTRVWEWLNRD